MKVSCGLLMYVRAEDSVRFLLVHPGGPYWRSKDEGAWSIPKGLAEDSENLLFAAQREFVEETNLRPTPPFISLTPVLQKGGKILRAWAFAGCDDLSAFHSNVFEMEWPRRSGRRATFPEADRAALFSPSQARRRILPGQRPLLDELEALLCG